MGRLVGTGRWSLRARIALPVTAMFVVSLATAGVAARHVLASAMEREQISIAQSILDDLIAPNMTLDDLASLRSDEVTRLIYLDAEGNEIGLAELLEILQTAQHGPASESEIASSAATDSGPVSPDVTTSPVDRPPADAASDLPDEGEVAEGSIADGVAESAVVAGARSASEESIDTVFDDDRLLVSRSVTVGTERVSIGVSSPRSADGANLTLLDRVGTALLALLAGLVATTTWLTVRLALRPVEAIRRQVERTDPSSLDRHVPRSGRGDEVDRLAATMNEMLDRLHQASLRHRQFVSDASHELRSPITATLATVETTQRGEVADRWPELASVIIGEQTRLSRLVDDLLLIAGFDEGNTPELTGEVDLDELAHDIARRPSARPIETWIGAPQRVAGNAPLLERCVANLVENAVRHAASRVVITVGATSDARPFLSVDDDGPGIPPEFRSAVFERFVRLDEDRQRRSGGAGLGLAIASEIAHQHQATLSVTESSSGGACFTLSFPASTTAAPPAFRGLVSRC